MRISQKQLHNLTFLCADKLISEDRQTCYVSPFNVKSLSLGFHNFFKNLGSRPKFREDVGLYEGKFHAETPQILRVTLQNLVALVVWPFEFVEFHLGAELKKKQVDNNNVPQPEMWKARQLKYKALDTIF